MLSEAVSVLLKLTVTGSSSGSLDGILKASLNTPVDVGEKPIVNEQIVFVDYDNDGDQDLFVANWTANKLYQNQLQETGVATFIEVAATACVTDFGRTTTASFADYDGDFGYFKPGTST